MKGSVLHPGGLPQLAALLLSSLGPCPQCCAYSHVPLTPCRRPCHAPLCFRLQTRPRGSAGWESSLRQKPPVRLIFQAGQTRHEMKIKEANSEENLRDLPTPLRVRALQGRGFPGLWWCVLLLCMAGRLTGHIAAAPCLSFPPRQCVCVLLLASALFWVL